MTLKEKHVSEEMRELAERCEAATGPSRHIDLEIARLQGVTVLARNEDDTANIETTYWHYTKSVDDALSLVPEGHFARIYGEGAQAIIVRPFSGGWLEVSRSALVLTPALALCAAALRALSTLREQTP